ncbi:MAG TPA: branched-chain amino acid transaminase [Methanomassiliicoccales archaeon]|nr:branched-chain amino acid transaminase [Methanomassiliicoccales archaeon]
MTGKPMVWMNGELIEEDKAVVPLMTHCLHYGTGVFEGIRVYETPKGRAIFRLTDHIVRFFNSAKALAMPMPYTIEQIVEASKLTVRETKVEVDYVRPIAFYSTSKKPRRIVLNPHDFNVWVAVATAYMGAYMGQEGLDHGAKIATSSWQKPTNASTSLQAKICGNYVNSAIAKIESNQIGVSESLMLNSNGTVAEGPGENVFMVKKGKLITPPLSACVLEGITKDSIMTIARDMGIEIVEREIPRAEIFIADEFFMTGTAAEVTPVAYLDGRPIGEGKAGPITKKLQKTFFDAARGKDPKYGAWLEYA